MREESCPYLNNGCDIGESNTYICSANSFNCPKYAGVCDQVIKEMEEFKKLFRKNARDKLHKI